METLRVGEVVLINIGPFSKLTVDFPQQSGLSIVCGDNGIGKTTLIDSIVAVFAAGQVHRLRKKYGSDRGQCAVKINRNGLENTVHIYINQFEPNANEWLTQNVSDDSNYIINISTNRDIGYIQQKSIDRDPEVQSGSVSQSLQHGLNAHQIKAWITNRYLLAPHKNTAGWTPDMVENLDAAIEFISILDPNVVLERVDVRTYDVLVKTPTGIVPFEYLSSGFRSAYVLLLGILKEIEFRKLGVSARKFSGVIIIDEIDLHLHPKWQQLIGGVLKKAFPSAQIIATTHSPHVIQAAEPSEVIALIRDENGDVRPRPIPSSIYGYAGWSVEEVLQDIMGVEDTKTSVFRDAMRAFDSAIDNEDDFAVQKALGVLLEMLHPDSPLRKLLKIQAAPFMANEE